MPTAYDHFIQALKGNTYRCQSTRSHAGLGGLYKFKRQAEHSDGNVTLIFEDEEGQEHAFDSCMDLKLLDEVPASELEEAAQTADSA